MQKIKMMVLACAASGLTACGGAAGYQSLDAGLPGATIQLNKSYGGTGAGSAANQFYAFAHDEDCASSQMAASFTWTTGDQASLRVPADQPIIVWAATVYLQTTSVSMVNGNPAPNVGQNGCFNNLQFTPRDGHTYDVRQASTRTSGECALQIVDLGTNAPPPDVELQKYEKCREAEG